MGTMRITPEAMEAVYGGGLGGGKTGAFELALQGHLNKHRSILLDEMDRQIIGVREEGVAGELYT